VPAKRTPNVTVGPAQSRSPTVTIGEATGTGQKIPSVTVGTGRAYGVTDTGSSALEIKELTGDERKIRLKERALPYKSVAFGVTHRIDETDYTGFSQTSQQALGAKCDETEMKGCWKTRFIGAPDSRMVEVTQGFSETIDGVEAINLTAERARSTEEVVALFEDMAFKGQVVRVQWRHVVRIGRIAQFVPTWLTAHDCEWSLKFKWIGRDENAGSPGIGGVGAGSIEISKRVAAGYVDLHNKTNLDDIPIDPAIADRIDSRVGRIKRSILEMEEAATNRVSSVTRPIEAMRRVMMLSTFVRDEAQAFIDENDAMVAPALLTVTDPSDLTTISAGRAIQAACAMRQAVRASRTLKHIAARQRYDSLRQLDANLIAIVLLKQDEDMAVLSARFYGTPEEGRRIRLFNNLDSNTAPAGTVVLIPTKDDLP
jgi:hypothetical protein